MRVMFAVGEEVRRNTNRLFPGETDRGRAIEGDISSERRRANITF